MIEGQSPWDLDRMKGILNQMDENLVVVESLGEKTAAAEWRQAYKRQNIFRYKILKVANICSVCDAYELCLTDMIYVGEDEEN